MPTFPSKPWNDGDTTSDGRYIYTEPPGAWKVIANPLDEDLVALAAANNSGVLVGTEAPFDSPRAAALDALSGVTGDGDSALDFDDLRRHRHLDRHQVISVAAAGDVTIDLSKGRFIHVPETAGNWSPDFQNVPLDGVQVILSVNVSGNGHEMLMSNGTWSKDSTQPTGASYDATDQMVFRLTKIPYVEKWIMEWLNEGTAPETDPVITPPTVTAVYSTSATGSSPTDLTGATLPSGEVAIFVGPDSSDVESYRLFVNHVGTLPAVGEEGDSYIGTRFNDPFALLGSVDGLATMWDTNEDPTGADRLDYDSNGETTLTVEPLLIDGVRPAATTFTFYTSNAPLGTDPVIYDDQQAYANANSDGTVTVPDGVDRTVVVQVHYKVVTSSQVMNGMTLNGNALTNIPAATFKDAQLLGVWTGYINEANLSTGVDHPLVASWDVDPGAFSAIIYNTWVITNVNAPSFGGIYDYDNVSPASPSSPSPSIASVPANSILLSSGTQANTDAADMTVDLGTPTTTTTVSGFLEGRSTLLDDSGVSATETANWVGTGKGFGILAYIDYSASGGGSNEDPPVIPGTPSVSLSTPADNQIVATWSATTDAVSYQIRWSQGADPTVPNGFPVSATSPKTITGLAPSQSYAVQVRAKSSTGDYSPWSSTAWIVTTGSTPPPPEFSGKFLTANNPFDVSYVEGQARYDYPDMHVLSAISRRNPGSTENGMRNLAQDNWLDTAIALWNRYKGDSSFINQMGPRLVVSMKLSPLGLGNHNAVSTTQESVAQVLDMGRTASRVSTGINRLDTLQALGNQLNRQYRGFNAWEMVHLAIAHETNGPWSKSGYMGLDPDLIGQPALLNASSADYGSAVAAALRLAGTTGECSAVHRLACENVMEQLWDINPNIILGMTPSDGEDSIPPDQPPSTISNTWVLDAFPRPSQGYKLDFLYPTVYARMPGDMQHTGGDRDVYSNWVRGDGWLEYADEYVADHGCAFGFLEVGVSYAVPGKGLVGDDVQAPSEEANVAFYERLFNYELNTTRFPQGFGAVNHWTKLRYQGKPPGVKVNGSGGGSYVLNEGMWGEYPDGTVPTSNNKPGFSTVTNPDYTKVRDWFRTNYPPI